MIQDTSDAIDAVILWVDGADPVHAARRARYLPFDPTRSTEGTGAQRFDESGEVYLCIASILAFLPFVRRIWIVTDTQRPVHLDAFADEKLCDPDRITVIDHSQILGDVPDALPTFNSRPLEAALWRIPGLAERYIYLNDDFFVNRPQPEDRFFANGRPVIAGRWRSLWARRLGDGLRDAVRRLQGKGPYDRPSFEAAIALGAWTAGRRRRYVRYDHWPHPARLSVQQTWHADHPDALARQSAYRFRNRAQFSPVSLAYHLENPDQLAAEPSVTYLTSTDPDRVAQARDQILRADTDYVVLQNLPALQASDRGSLLAACAQKFADHLPQPVIRHLSGATVDPAAPQVVSP